MKTLLNTFILLILLLISYQTNAQTLEDSSLLTILTYGSFQRIEHTNAEDVVGKRWGIQFRRVGNCLISPFLAAEVRKNNEPVYAQLIEQYGEDWRTQFDEEVKKELNLQLLARELIKEQSYIVLLDSILSLEGKEATYYLNEETPHEKYSASIFGWGERNGKQDQPISYFKLSVDVQKREVTIN